MNIRNSFILFIVLLLISVSISEAIFPLNLLGIGSKKGDTKYGINDVKTGINDVQTKLDDVKLGVNDVQAKIDLQAQVNAKAFAGLDKSNTNTAGRDAIQTTTNETELMKYIIKGLVGLCTTLIGILGWCLKTLLKRDKEKKFYKEVCLTKTVKDENDLMNLRQLHDNFVKHKKGVKNNG